MTIALAHGLDQTLSAVRRARRGALRRQVRVVMILTALLMLAFAMALSLGDFPVAPAALLTALVSPLTGIATPGADFIVLQLRLPRAVLALLSGAAFGLSGYLFQSLLRNPLASPDIIGISRGASAAAVCAIVILGWSGGYLAIAALSGALLTAAAIYLLAWRDNLSPYRVVLVGIGVESVLIAIIAYLFTTARIFEVQQALGWMVGSLNGARWAEAGIMAATLVVLVPAALALQRGLGALALGDDAAIALGTRLEPVRLGIIVVAVALSGLATACVGPVAFIAFVAGPIAIRLLGSGNALIPAMLVGALVMLGGDLAAQHAIPGLQLPVGVVTGLFGAIFLLGLLAGANRRGTA
jgi:iron complex transport system permease protein